MRAFPRKGCRASVPCVVHPTSLITQAGFSLVELLVVLAVLIVLTTLYWGFSSPNYQRRQTKLCAQSLQKIQVAMEIYARENRDRFPATAGARTAEDALDVLIPRYTADTSIFVCPGSKDAPVPEAESIRNRKVSYAYFMGRRLADARETLMSDRQIDALPKSAGQLVFSSTGKPPGNNHSSFGGNFLFCDGHVEFSPPVIPFSTSLPPNVVLLNPKP